MGEPMEVATITNPSGIDMEMYLLLISGFFLVNITHVRFLSLSVRNGMDGEINNVMIIASLVQIAYHLCLLLSPHMLLHAWQVVWL